MQPPNIFISTPCYSGKVDLNYHTSMMMTMKFLGENRIQHMFNYAVSTGVDAARSKHATEFLRTKCTHFMMIDDDMAWAPDLVFRMLMENVDIVGVPYRRKMVNPVRFTARHGTELEYKENKPYMIKVEGVGTGMMLVKREVFEKLLPEAPAIQYNKDGPLTHMFFRHDFVDDHHINGKTYMSEDYNFCRLARNAGFDVWAYADEETAHMGQVAYRGSYADMLEKDSDKKFRYERQRSTVRLVGDLVDEIIEIPLECEVDGQKKLISAQAIRMEEGVLIPFYALSDPESEDAQSYLAKVREIYHTEDTEKGLRVFGLKQNETEENASN